MRGRFGRARPLTCSPYITPKSPERGATGGPEARRAGEAPGRPRWRRRAGRALRSRGAGGGGGETGVGAEGRGFEGKGGEEPRGPCRFRTGKLVLPKSRHPGVRTPLRSGREPPGRAGRRGSPKSGHEPGEKVRRRGHHLSPSGAGVRRNAENQWRQAAGRPSAPGEQEARRPSGRERQRGEPGAPAERRRADAAKVCCLRSGPGGRRGRSRSRPAGPLPGAEERGARDVRRRRPRARVPQATAPPRRAAANCERGLICIGRPSPLEAGQSARPSANGHALFTSLIAQPHARPAQPPLPPPAPRAPRRPRRPPR
ncbi:collagen alpha-1(I) chain-like [Oryx dammah]|uniref:collagen alpha-1(I) chain-like n=1 Tax=Oryx dammah TaxID=59534 RepID=UPI001A9B302B|nr:collagen alpha-1(I) chain-like [Oryx dammah]